ncbi:MAG: SRPBCC family protein [Geminicoccaceae bacterium]
MKLHQTNDTLLRRTLQGNAIFSTVTGLACLLMPGLIADLLFSGDGSLLGFSPSPIILGLGIGVLAFAGLVFFVAKPTIMKLGLVKLIILADVLWVLDSAILLVFFSSALSPIGFEAVLITAVIVLVFATGQALGMASIYQGNSDVKISVDGPVMSIEAALGTKAEADRVWQVMSDQEAYADVADNLSKVEVLEGQGKDMIRRCYDTKGQSWTESCTLWDEGRAFGFRVHTEAADYPYPIAKLSGLWSLTPMAHGTEIKMVFTVEAKTGLANHLLFKVMAAPFAKICDRLLRSWAQIMEERLDADTSTSAKGARIAQPA